MNQSYTQSAFGLREKYWTNFHTDTCSNINFARTWQFENLMKISSAIFKTVCDIEWFFAVKRNMLAIFVAHRSPPPPPSTSSYQRMVRNMCLRNRTCFVSHGVLWPILVLDVLQLGSTKKSCSFKPAPVRTVHCTKKLAAFPGKPPTFFYSVAYGKHSRKKKIQYGKRPLLFEPSFIGSIPYFPRQLEWLENEKGKVRLQFWLGYLERGKGGWAGAKSSLHNPTTISGRKKIFQ